MRHFTYKSLDELRQSCRDLGAVHVGFEPDPGQVRSILARKVQVGPVTVGNSLAIHPMEGCDGTLDGCPGELTWRRYERFARGGAKLLWFEATAINPEARANTRQLWITRANVDEYARLLEMMRRWHAEHWGSSDDLLIPMQLTHSGRYSVPRRIIAYHNPLIGRKTGVAPDYPVISDDQLERLEDEFVDAARLALSAGFNAIDLKVTHGYLLNELLGAKQRPAPYGGSLENRTRVIRNTVGKLRAAFGNRLLLCMRLGCFDGIPYESPAGVPFAHQTPYLHGWGVDAADPLADDLTEVKTAIGWFRDWGIQLLNVSLACPYYNPHVLRPFEAPDEGNYEQPEHPLHGVDRHFRIAGELQRTFPDLPMVGTGYSWLQIYAINAGARNVADGNIRFMGAGATLWLIPISPAMLWRKASWRNGACARR